MEKTLGILRHVLTFLGGIALMNGIADESLVQEISGAALTLVGAVWSVISKKQKI
jgi:hypothetical protein